MVGHAAWSSAGVQKVFPCLLTTCAFSEESSIPFLWLHLCRGPLGKEQKPPFLWYSCWFACIAVGRECASFADSSVPPGGRYNAIVPLWSEMKRKKTKTTASQLKGASCQGITAAGSLHAHQVAQPFQHRKRGALCNLTDAFQVQVSASGEIL